MSDDINFDGFRFCAHQGSSAPIGAGGLPKWPHKRITWRVISPLPQFTLDAYRDAIREAFERWAAVCGIDPVEVVEKNTRANIEFKLIREMPGGKLAECYLPYPGISPVDSLDCNVDAAEGKAWTISDNPPTNRIDLVRVLTHELGHGLGVSHLGEQSGAIMAPFYSSRIGWPQAGDTAEVVARYGPPDPNRGKSAPIPTTPEGVGSLLAVLQDGGRMVVTVGSGVVVRFPDGREVQA